MVGDGLLYEIYEKYEPVSKVIPDTGKSTAC